MYCSHCGKKVGDTMLFCPFCGEPIVIPEQDDPKPAEPAAQTVPAPEPIPGERTDGASEAESARPEPETSLAEESADAGETDAAAELLNWSRERESHTDAWARPEQPEEPFTPLQLDADDGEAEDWREEISRKKQSVAQEKKPPRMHRDEGEPVRLEGSAPKLELDVEGAKPAGDGKARRKHANTLVPPKTMDPNDIFMDGKADDYDEYDSYDDDTSDEFSSPFVYEDEEEGSFFMRHLRGIVGLSMFAILLLLFVIFAFSKAGQITLAKANLAWSTEAYSTLGYQSYQAGQYSQAGLYYERALQRSPNNYSYASSAAMAYYEAGDVDRSTAMLKRCAEIDPVKLEPYVYLLKLYPDAASRPWDVTQLLQQGYRQTGDSRLNVTG